MLSVESSKPITVKRLDFLMSSGACVATSELEAHNEAASKIPIDQTKAVKGGVKIDRWGGEKVDHFVCS